LKEHEDIPRTVIGYTALPKSFSIFLRGDSIKKIAKKIREGEDLRITVGDNGHSIKIVDTHNKYNEAKES